MALNGSLQVVAAEAFTGLIILDGAVQFDLVGWLVIGHSMDRAARVISSFFWMVRQLSGVFTACDAV